MDIEQLIEKLQGLRSRNPYAEVEFHKSEDATSVPVQEPVNDAVYDVHSRKVVLS